MMKIGLIADIHANLTALERSLEILNLQKVDQVLCAGDLVEKGPGGDAVVDRLRMLSIPCVMGNHDFDAIGNQVWLRENADLSHPAIQGKLLREETLSFLGALPRSLDFSWKSRRIVLTHGAPWSTNEYVFPTSPALVFERICKETRADVVVLGHTHRPMCIRINDTRIINPGAVCGNYPDGKGSCAVLSLPECLIQIFSLEDGTILGEFQ
jgi:putative phosphoesterase